MSLLFFNKNNYFFNNEDIKRLENIFIFFKNHFNLEASKEIELDIVDNEKIQKINKEFRGKDKPTDVLSFSFIEDNLSLLGCIYISYEMISSFSNKSFSYNLSFLFIHGLLHIYGYDHGKEMSRKEEIMISAFF